MAIKRFSLDGQLYELAHTYYGDCLTAGDDATKVVAVDDNFSLVKGARIVVHFTVTNTVSDPTLDVNSTGAKPIFYKGTSIPMDVLTEDSSYDFVYNGEQYEYLGTLYPSNLIEWGSFADLI